MVKKDVVLVCVTGQKTCERLILEGADIAKGLGAELSVLHVAAHGLNFLGNPLEGEALEYLYGISSRHGAAMTLIRADDVTRTILHHAEQIDATHLVMGHAKERVANDVTDGIILLRPDLFIHSIDA